MSNFLQEGTQFQHTHGSRFISNSNFVPPRHTFSFPLLKTDEITKCLNELGIPLTQDDLMNPDRNPESCRKMLEIMAEICTGISKEELLQPLFPGLQGIPYPELHEESIPKLNNFRSVSKMMEMCEIPDFTIRDVMAPTAGRLRRHLSGIINFAKFREERLILLSELNSNRENLADQLRQVRERNETLNNRLCLLKEQTAEESGIICCLESECDDIEKGISVHNQTQSSLREEASHLKVQTSNLRESIADRIRQRDELATSKKQLSLQIVSSPEKFRKQITEVGQTLQNEQRDAKMAEKKVKGLTAWLSNVQDAQEEVSFALEHIVDLRGEVDRQKTAMSDLEAKKQVVAAGRAALSELDQNIHHLHRHAMRADEKLQHIRKQAQSRSKDAQTAVDELHTSLIEAEAFRLQVAITERSIINCLPILPSVHLCRSGRALFVTREKLVEWGKIC